MSDSFTWMNMDVSFAVEAARRFFAHWDQGVSLRTERLENVESPDSELTTAAEMEELKELDFPSMLTLAVIWYPGGYATVFRAYPLD